MKLGIWLMASSAVLATSAAYATPAANTLYISGDQPASMTITQDSTKGGNAIGSSITAFTLSGAIKTIVIDQTGTGNSLAGSITVGNAVAVGSKEADLTQEYKGSGYNIATVNIGASKAPNKLTGSIAFTSTATGSSDKNTLIETANTDGALTYAIAVSGKGNSLTDSLSATGDIANIQTIATDTNTVSNTITGADSIALTNNIAGIAGNSITTTSLGSGAKVVNNKIVSGSAAHTITTEFNSVAGAQSSALTITGGQVDFGLNSNAASSSSTVALTDVAASGTAAKVGVIQTANAASAVAKLTVVGTGFSTGTIGGVGANANYAVYVNQNTPSAVLNASLTATANSYTVNISQ